MSDRELQADLSPRGAWGGRWGRNDLRSGLRACGEGRRAPLGSGSAPGWWVSLPLHLFGNQEVSGDASLDTQGSAEVVQNRKSTLRTGSHCSEAVRAAAALTLPLAAGGGKKGGQTPLHP